MQPTEKTCPNCHVTMRSDAVTCWRCGVQQPPTEQAVPAKRGSPVLIGCAGLFGLTMLVTMCSLAVSGGSGGNMATPAATPSVSPREAAAAAVRNKAAIAAKLKEVRRLPAGDVDGNLAGYQALVTLDPGNAALIERRDHFQGLKDREGRYADHPEEALKVSRFTWEKGGFRSVMLVHLTVTNQASFPIKDFELSCRSQGASGTDMDSNTRTVYELVPAHGSRRIREVNMGLINSQVATTDCTITSAVAAN